MNKRVVIERVAFIEMCGCGLHGHIAFPDGDISHEFFSKEEAIEVITENLKEGYIQKDEKEFLCSEIDRLKFFSDRLLPQIHEAMRILKKTGHPQEIIEKIVRILYEIANELYDEYCGDHETSPDAGSKEIRGTLH